MKNSFKYAQKLDMKQKEQQQSSQDKEKMAQLDK